MQGVLSSDFKASEVEVVLVRYCLVAALNGCKICPGS